MTSLTVQDGPYKCPRMVRVAESPKTAPRVQYGAIDVMSSGSLVFQDLTRKPSSKGEYTR